ncbi:MAG: hypothetical protein QW328_06850, partial [Nitrososphaerota archaeon]
MLGPSIARDVDKNVKEIIPFPRDIILLDKGIDLWTPATLLAPGALLDCRNYEITNVLGLKRIDGYQFYDGRLTTASMYWHTIIISGLIPFSSAYPVYLCPQNNDVPFGVVCEVFYDTVNNLSYVRFFPIEEELFPSAGDPIRVAILSGANYSYASGYNAQNYPDLFDSSVFSSFLAANFPSEVISSATQAVRKINQYHAQQQSFV